MFFRVGSAPQKAHCQSLWGSEVTRKIKQLEGWGGARAPVPHRGLGDDVNGLVMVMYLWLQCTLRTWSVTSSQQRANVTRTGRNWHRGWITSPPTSSTAKNRTKSVTISNCAYKTHSNISVWLFVWINLTKFNFFLFQCDAISWFVQWWRKQAITKWPSSPMTRFRNNSFPASTTHCLSNTTSN